MAQQGKCPTCKAAFAFPEMRGFPACPHCGAILVQTTHDYGRGPWFTLRGTSATMPNANHPEALNPATRPAYYRAVLADQEVQRRDRDARHLRDRLARVEAATPEERRYIYYSVDSLRDDLAKAEQRLTEAERKQAKARAALDKQRAAVAAPIAAPRYRQAPDPADFPDDEIGYYEALEYHRAGI